MAQFQFTVIFFQLQSIQMNNKQKQWMWKNCSSSIKRIDKYQQQKSKCIQYFDLKPLIYKNKFQRQTPFTLEVQMNKQFLYEQEIGYTWHKSWIIPQIIISFSLQQWKLLRILKQNKKIFAQLCCVVMPKSSCNDSLEVIPLSKSSLIEMTQRQINFTNYKFSKTSFHHNRNKFNLMIWIYFQDEVQNKRTISSQISTQFYVDSRKQARKGKQEQAQISIKEKVDVETFQTPIKMLKGKKHFKVQNSIEGFIEYYSAQRVRNKIKNPFYIAYHFGLTIKCFYNRQVVRNPLQALRILQSTQYYCDNVVTLVVLTQDLETIKKLRHIFEKLLKLKDVNILYSRENCLQDKKWINIPRKNIIQIYQQFYQTQQINKSSSSSSVCVIPWQTYECHTQIIIQAPKIKQQQ